MRQACISRSNFLDLISLINQTEICDVITWDNVYVESPTFPPTWFSYPAPPSINMSSPITAVRSTHLTGETTLCDNDDSSRVQLTSSDLPTPRLDLGPPQRRRVNPESLAARLGPELVAEMEKHIIPGNIEMPPFSVRRDIQVKFGIDRRHIYDFFHSRGLRCLNERAVRSNCLEVRYQL